jgi:hypothetical protein
MANQSSVLLHFSWSNCLLANPQLTWISKLPHNLNTTPPFCLLLDKGQKTPPLLYTTSCIALHPYDLGSLVILHQPFSSEKLFNP